MGLFERGGIDCDVPELVERRTELIKMRKPVGVSIAVAIALATLLSGPAEGLAAKTGCKTMTGVARFAPPLPKLGNKKTVVSTVTVTGAKIGGCVGGGISAAAATLTAKFAKAGNCTTVGTGVRNVAAGTLVLTWNTNKSSTVAATLSMVPQKPTTLKIGGTVSSGLFKGSKITETVIYAPSGGGCTKTALSKATFKQTTPLVIK